MLQRFFSGRGFYLGDMFEQAAGRHGGVTVALDKPLDVAPSAGTGHTYRTIADLVEALAAQLWAAGVRPTERVTLYKSDNFDLALLTCALSRIGAVPALLSPTLDGTVVVELLRRLDRPWLITDAAKLAGPLQGPALTGLTRRSWSSAPTPSRRRTRWAGCRWPSSTAPSAARRCTSRCASRR